MSNRVNYRELWEDLKEAYEDLYEEYEKLYELHYGVNPLGKEEDYE